MFAAQQYTDMRTEQWPSPQCRQYARTCQNSHSVTGQTCLVLVTGRRSCGVCIANMAWARPGAPGDELFDLRAPALG